MKDNPFRGGLQGNDWYRHVINVPDFGTMEFLAQDSFNWAKTPCLIGSDYELKQWCSNCGKDIDQGKFIFVVHRVRSHIDYHFVSKLSLKLDAEDVFCSKEKFPKFKEWQMEEHKKTCGKANPVQP